ncbi:MAG: sodium:proton antiporter [Candidatus Eisenbacteria bacterium]
MTSPWNRLSHLLRFVVLLVLVPALSLASEGGGAAHGDLAEKLPWFSVVPFVLLLVSIAVLPLVAHHWWEHLRNRAIIAWGLSIPVLIYLLIHGRAELAHSMIEYLAFIALLGSLFVISGGIVVSGDIRATPAVNTGFLAIGAILANFIGTTGASMLLIRPFLKTNSERQRSPSAHLLHLRSPSSNVGAA